MDGSVRMLPVVLLSPLSCIGVTATLSVPSLRLTYAQLVSFSMPHGHFVTV